MKLTAKFYKDFPKATKFFEQETRYFCYEISRELIRKAQAQNKNNWYCDDYTIKAILLLLFCWNFAAKITKKLQMGTMKKLLENQSSNLKSLEQFSIRDNLHTQQGIITTIYTAFKKTVGQTGASKALSLLNPKLFVMWDTGIRAFLSSKKADSELKIARISNGEDSQSYTIFLLGIKNIIDRLDLTSRLKNKDEIAKKIDEYHYVKLIM